MYVTDELELPDEPPVRPPRIVWWTETGRRFSSAREAMRWHKGWLAQHSQSAQKGWPELGPKAIHMQQTPGGNAQVEKAFAILEAAAKKRGDNAP